jgi:hypothetical protein
LIFCKSSLGACPRIGISSQIEKFSKNKHSHMYDIGVYAYLRALFFENSEELGEKGILGQDPREQQLFFTTVPVTYYDIVIRAGGRIPNLYRFDSG